MVDNIWIEAPDNIWLEGRDVEITKTLPDKQYAFGWASVATDKDGNIPIDWAGDVIPEDELESMAYSFVRFYGQTGEQHAGEAFGEIIESMVFSREKLALLGIPEGCVHIGWWVGFYIPDIEIFNKVKDGTYKMFSIQGSGKRIPI